MSPDLTAQGSLLATYGVPPDEIERLSLARLEARVGARLPADERMRGVVQRVLYAAGDPDLLPSVRFTEDFVETSMGALKAGAPVVVDVSMVAAGVRQDLLARYGGTLSVAIQQPGASQLAAEWRTTRAAASFRLLGNRLDGAVVVIGNAPTALLQLLDQLDAGVSRPAAIIGMPVGLVAASESKRALVERQIPSATVLGTRGGSPLAAAALNAVLDLATADD